MKWKEQAKKLKSDIPALFLALKDTETPMIAKALAGITIVYALSPIDLIPDFISVLGYIDDLILLPVLVSLTINFIPEEVFQRNREKAKDLWADGKPKKWYYATPVISIWILIVWIIIKIILH